MTIAQSDLDLHRAWLRGELGGVRLDRRGADLTGANLTGAYLTRANLTRANLTRADLSGADLDPIRDDLWAILDAAPAEVPGLRLALIESRVDGSTYTGECCCLVGTIANLRGCSYEGLSGVTPNTNRPAERWFLAIRPECSQYHPIVVITLQWIDEWTARRAAEVVQ